MSLRTAKQTVGMEADVCFDMPERSIARAALLRNAARRLTDQSLPEKMRVLCPPGTRGFREPFFALWQREM